MSEPVEVRGAIAISGLRINRQVALRPNKDNLTFEFVIDQTFDVEDVKDILDRINLVLDRERWKAELIEKETAQAAQAEQPRQADKEIARLQARRWAYLAAAQAAHERSGRRMPFKTSPKMQTDLEAFDKGIEAEQANKAAFLRDAPLTQWEIDCLKAKIAGAPLPPRPELFDAAIEAIRPDAA